MRENVDRAIRLACYITANKLVFYQALRRTRTFKLQKLAVPAHIDSGERLRDHFASLFHEAKLVTHDYQTIFEGGFIDRVPFIADQAVERWRTLVGGELAIMFCFVFLYLAANGPGPWSIDAKRT